MDRMIVRQWPSTSSDQDNPVDREFISLPDITGFLKLYSRSIAGCLGVGLLGAGFYVVTTDRIYTASTQILIEPKIPQLLQQGAAEVNLSLDTAQVESQIAVMRSEKIAMMVIDELKLMDDVKFNRPRNPTLAGRFGKFVAVVGETLGVGTGESADSSESRSDEAPTTESAGNAASEAAEFVRSRRTMWTFQDGLDIRRLGVSYAIEISFSSPDAEMAARIANATANALVREQLETKSAAAREGGAWLEKRLGQLRTQMNTATQVAQEFRAKHDYSVARQPDAATVDEQTVDEWSTRTEPEGPTLEELEVTADTYRKMYESFLQAYTSSVSQQSYPVADARVITPASRPLLASHPRRKLIVAFAALFGLLAGVSLAFVRHTFDHTLRSPRQIRKELGLQCVGELPPASRGGHSGRMDEVARFPHSPFSHALSRVKTAISIADTAHAVRWLGMTSTAEGEGKCSAAINLATLYAMCGKRVLVIDADVHHSETTNQLLAGSLALPKPLTATSPVSRNIIPVPNRAFDMLPSACSDAKKLLVPKTMQAFLEASGSYDIVIVVLPSFTAGADSLAVSSALDGILLVARWGMTSMDLLTELVRSMHANKASIVGVLMTDVRTQSAKHVAAHTSVLRPAGHVFPRGPRRFAARIGNAVKALMRRA